MSEPHKLDYQEDRALEAAVKATKAILDNTARPSLEQAIGGALISAVYLVAAGLYAVAREIALFRTTYVKVQR